MVSAATLASLQGCLLIGYEPLRSPGSDSDAGGAGWTGDARVGEPRDADSHRSEASVAADSGAGHDPGLDAGDGSDAGRESARDADVSAGDAASCASRNACGGCAPLPNLPGDGCGLCGLGRYACSGSEAVVCEGGDARPAASGGRLLIDDLEDGDRFIRPESGLSGDWHTVADSTSGTLQPALGTPIVPSQGGAGASAYSVHVSGYGFSDWGAGVAVSLNAYQCSYDASAQSGIEFAVKGSGNVIVSVATRTTTPPSAGGTCLGDACNDHFAASIPLTSAWTSHKRAWSALKQAGWGTPATFSAGEIVYIQFSFGPGSSFDLYVDDLAFY